MTIIADILRALASSRAAKKMSIVYKTNLNFERINRYLDFLVLTEHIEVIPSLKGNVSYRITDKGRQFLTRYERLMGSLIIPESAQVTATQPQSISTSPI